MIYITVLKPKGLNPISCIYYLVLWKRKKDVEFKKIIYSIIFDVKFSKSLYGNKACDTLVSFSED